MVVSGPGQVRQRGAVNLGVVMLLHAFAGVRNAWSLGLASSGP